MSTPMKLTQKVDHFTVFESFPSTSCCSHKFPPKKLAGWMCEVVTGRFTLGGWWGMDWQEKITVQNFGRALVKPKTSLEGLCWFLNDWNEAQSTLWTFGLLKQAATLDIASPDTCQCLKPAFEPFTSLWIHPCYNQPWVSTSTKL